MTKTTPLIEVCVESADALRIAQDNGADRVELCASLSEGGVTPSLGTVKGALAVARLPVHVIVRPRGGDFVYSDLEYASMLEDVHLLGEAGAHGVVLGCLTGDGQVDVARTRALVARAGSMSVTFHRAFDMTADPVRALEQLIACGVDRVLTSGQQATALAGSRHLRELLARAGDRIGILGCGRIRPDSVADVLRQVPLLEIHFSAQRSVPNVVPVENRQVSLGQGEEDSRLVTSAQQVAATVAAARLAVQTG